MSTTRRPWLLAALVSAALVPVAGARADDPPPHVGPAGDDCRAERYAVRSPRSDAHPPLPEHALGRPVLRFVNLSDSHIIDDEASAVMSGNATEVTLDLMIGNNSAQRLQEEYTDEVLDAMVARINECQAQMPSAFMIATGDLTDNMTLNELRRYIDNLDGSSGAPTAAEHFCGYDQGGLTGRPDQHASPSDCPTERLAEIRRVAGRTVHDSQAPRPDPDDPTYRFALTRSPRQLAESTAGALRDGTYTTAPGLPASMSDPAANHRIDVPHYAVFGNHDGAVRGTVVYQDAFGPGAGAFGRHFVGSQREFINEFFFTSTEPAGHGFNHVDEARLGDDDERNDGWYAFEAGGVRLIVLNTIIDGVVDGSPVRDPSALEAGGMERPQFEWLDAELRAADDLGQPALVFSHHPTRSFHDDAQGVELDRMLAGHQSVVAHIAGHTHENRVRPRLAEACADCGGQHDFWQVETASLVDYPQEGRIVELYRVGAGRWALRLTMIEPDRDTDGPARWSYELSKAEATCMLSAITAGPLAAGAPDAARVQQITTNASEAAVRQKFCFGESSLTAAAGAPGERDVILLP